VEQLVFDGGNEIHTYPFPFRDGEGGEFNVASLAGIEVLANLRGFNVISILEEGDLARLEPLGRLEKVGLSRDRTGMQRRSRGCPRSRNSSASKAGSMRPPSSMLSGLRRCRGISAPSGLFFCPPAALQKGLHILDMRPFLRLAAEQNPSAIWRTYSSASPKLPRRHGYLPGRPSVLWAPHAQPCSQPDRVPKPTMRPPSLTAARVP
jgi:hypothetical protein